MTFISLARGVPTTDLLPIPAIREASARALDAEAAEVLAYGPGGGYPPLREALAARHGVDPGRILVVNGSLQGLTFIAEHLRRTGQAHVAVEAPTYDRALKNFADRDFRITSIPLEADGIDVEALAEVETPDLLYTIPTFQNPAGCTLSLSKRRRLAELARERDLLIYEDDPYRLLRFEGEQVPALHDLAPERVIWSTSFTKTVAPGLRVGYLIVPEPLVARLTELAVDTYVSPSLLPEAIVADLLGSGAFEESVELARKALAERLGTMCDALDEHLPEARYVRPQGGYFLWLQLPEGVEVGAVLGAAKRHGVVFVPGTDFLLDGGERHLRLAFSGVQPRQIGEAVRRLSAAVSDAGG